MSGSERPALPDFWLRESRLREHLLRRLADAFIGIQQRLLQQRFCGLATDLAECLDRRPADARVRIAECNQHPVRGRLAADTRQRLDRCLPQVIEEVAAWQARPLESSYAIVFFDALRVKIRDEGLVRNKA